MRELREYTFRVTLLLLLLYVGFIMDAWKVQKGSIRAPVAPAIEAIVYSCESLMYAQRLQYPLITEYTLNHITDPTII